MAQYQKASKIKKKQENKRHKEAIKARDLLDIIDSYLDRKQNVWFWMSFAISVLFTVLIFDLRVSVGGDDSAYIIRAFDFISDFKYPSFQGPLYPIVLSIFVGFFGISLPVLKGLSALFLSGHLYFFYKAFKNRIPGAILISSILLIAINSYLLFYGSQTYAEAFFLFAQVLFFLYFFKYFITDNEPSTGLKEDVKKHLLLGVIIVGLGLIKSLGYSALFAVIAYFIIEKKWKPIGFTIAGFAISFGMWRFLKFLLWGNKEAQFSSQASTLFQKHPYDASKGAETLSGFIERFIDNSNIYLSRQLMKVLGLRPELVEVDKMLTAPPVMPFLTILVYLILIVAFIWAIRKNKYLLFTGIYLAILTGITFIILQTMWEGTRLLIALFPFMMLFLMAGSYYLFKFEKLKALQFVFPIVVAVLFFSAFSDSSTKIKEHQKIFKYQLRGNVTAGLTPDWVNYINMCKWSAENVPEGKIIASRKPSIAFIYTGRRFHGVYKVKSTDPDSLLNRFLDYNVEYVVMASLRKIEARKTQYTINTIQRHLYYIKQKYPNKLKLVHQIGADEPAYLFKIE